MNVALPWEKDPLIPGGFIRRCLGSSSNGESAIADVSRSNGTKLWYCCAQSVGNKDVRKSRTNLLSKEEAMRAADKLLIQFGWKLMDEKFSVML